MNVIAGQQAQFAKGWVYLAPDVVKDRHPLYGIGGWAILLMLGLVADPLVNLLVTINYARHLSSGWQFIFYIRAIVGFATLWAALRLANHKENFQYVCTAVVAGLLALDTVLALVAAEGLSKRGSEALLVEWVRAAIPSGLWLVYIWRSKRVNVTCRSRVRPNDPFLQHVSLVARGKPEKSSRADVTTMAAFGSAKRKRATWPSRRYEEDREQPEVGRLRTLKKAYDEGLLSQDEYEQKRHQIAGQM